jgi:hypothetical protein
MRTPSAAELFPLPPHDDAAHLLCPGSLERESAP